MKVSFVEHNVPLHADQRRQLLTRGFSSNSTFLDLNPSSKINLILANFHLYSFKKVSEVWFDWFVFGFFFPVCFFCDILMLT